MQPEYSRYDAAVVPPPQGINNSTGSACWANSLIQFLLGMPALNKFITENEFEFVGNTFAREYARIVNESMAGKIVTNMSLLAALNSAMEMQGLKFNMRYGQECADEAFTIFIDLFNHMTITNTFTSAYQLNVYCNQCDEKTSVVRDRALRIQIGEVIYLETPTDFTNYIRRHHSICDYYKCECGNKMVNFRREECLCKLGEILVITFNKFHTKDRRWFPETLTFPGKNGTNMDYILIGAITHYGNMHSGHYIAHSFRGKWYKFNDADYSAEIPVPNENTFMLAYHLQ